MPVAPRCEPLFDGHRPPTGKEPGRLELQPDGEERWVRLKRWTTFCTRQVRPEIVAHWSRMSDAGVCVATGFNNLVAVDIDRDDLIADILAALPRALVGKVGKRGATYFFRTTEPMPSTTYKDSEKRGLLDFLSSGRQSVIPDTIHPDLGRPYEWLTPATLLNTPLEALPEFTSEHRAEMERVLRAHGWDAPEPAVACSRTVVERPTQPQSAASNTGGWYDNFKRAAIAGMQQWVPKLGLHSLERISNGWRAVASFRGSGSGTPLTKRNQNLAIYDTGRIKDYSAGQGYNVISLVAVCLFGSKENTKQAIAWLRDEIGFDDTPADIEHPVTPTYNDNRVSLDEASEPLRAVFGDGFKDAILAGRAARNQARIKPPLIDPDFPVEIIPTETGIGKTHAAKKGLTPLAKLGFKFVYAVPYHKLADDVAADFSAEGLEKELIEVYRGYDRPDPRAPKKYKMCRRPEEFKAVRDLGIPTHSAICESKPDLVAIRCPHASRCGLMRQRKRTPNIWIVPSALLFTKKPSFFPEIDAVVIDESFIDNVYGNPFEIDVQVLRDIPLDKDLYNIEEQDELTRFRRRLRDAIKENGDGPVSRAVLLDHEIDCETAWWLSKLEHRPLDSVDLSPEMMDREVRSAAKKLKTKATQARKASAMWDEISTFLGEHWAEEFYGDRSLSGRLLVKDGMLLVKPFRTVHPSWREAPLAYLDATPPPTRLVEIALGEIVVYGLPSVVSRQPEIAARWSPHVRVRQILGGPATMSSVGVGAYAREKQKANPNKELKSRKVTEIVSYIQLQAALAYPARIGVITFKELRERISGRIPSKYRVEWMHHGALAGRNNMKEITGLIVLGRPAARRGDVEGAASVFAGRPIGGGSDSFDHDTGGIRLADGTVRGVCMERHTDPIVEALRWQITEGNLIQAIGRIRPHRRDTPCWLDIVTDVPLPITVGECAHWDDVTPGVIATMVLQGVVLTNSRDAMSAFSLSKHAAERAGEVAPKTLTRSILLEFPGQLPPVQTFTYQRAGQGWGRNTGYYLPAVIDQPAELRDWLEAKLGPLVALEIEHPTGLAEWQPASLPLGELVSVFGGGWLGELAEGDDS